MDDKKIKGKRRRRCSHCLSLKYDIKTSINPFDQDVHNIVNKEPICKECYKNIQDEI